MGNALPLRGIDRSLLDSMAPYVQLMLNTWTCCCDWFGGVFILASTSQIQRLATCYSERIKHRYTEAIELSPPHHCRITQGVLKIHKQVFQQDWLTHSSFLFFFSKQSDFQIWYGLVIYKLILLKKKSESIMFCHLCWNFHPPMVLPGEAHSLIWSRPANVLFHMNS